MGKYINYIEGESLGKSFNSKCNVLESKGATRVTDKEFLPNMICVVDNGFFAAAGYAYSENEYKQFKHLDGRPRKWYTLKDAEKHVDK